MLNISKNKKIILYIQRGLHSPDERIIRKKLSKKQNGEAVERVIEKIKMHSTRNVQKGW